MQSSFVARAPLAQTLLAAACVALGSSPWAQCEVDKFVGSGAHQGDQFAGSLALEELTAIVGCTKCDDQGGESGAAYVFTYDGYAWIQRARLFAADGVPFDHLGTDVDLTPDASGAVAGAPDDDRPGLTNAGAAYVFFDDGVQWAQYTKLVANDAANGDHFGFSVATSGTVIAVGAPDRAGGGAVYVFKLFGAQWFQTQKLTAPDGHAGAAFGYEVDFDGTTIAVGSRRWDAPGAPGAGKVYLYTQPGATFALQGSVQSIDPKQGDGFGSALAIDGARLFVGAPEDDDQGFGSNSNTGVGFHFTRSGSTWSFVEKVLPPQTSHGFSNAAALEGSTLVVGAFLDKQIGSDGGAVHVFELTGGSFDHQEKILLSDHVPLSEVGGSVAVAGDLLLVSSEFDDSVGTNSGAAYGFSLSGKNCEELYAWPEGISIATGGAQDWTLDVGPIGAGFVYWVVGSFTTGGFQAGNVFIPLDHDVYTQVTVQLRNTPVFPNSLGFFDASGKAASGIVLPSGLDAGLVGLELFHAFLVYNPAQFTLVHASNVTSVVLAP